jgi:hypothetical protein
VRRNEIKQIIYLVLLLAMLVGCNKKIDLDQLPISTGTFKEEGTSYFVLNFHPKESMTLDLVELPSFQDAEVEVMEYTTVQAPEGWEKSKRLSFPAEISEDKPVTIVFTSMDPAIDLTENEDVSLTINGEHYLIDNVE